MKTETADKVIDLSKYTHCKVFSDNELVMFTESEPIFDLGKKRIGFSRVAIKNCFQGRYLGTDFVVELYESDLQEEPSIFFYDSGIINFGLLELVENETGRFVLVDNMEFEFDWANDVKDRLTEAIRLAEIEEAERRKREIRVGDRVSHFDSFRQVTLVGTVKYLPTGTSNSYGVEFKKQPGNDYVSTRYLAKDKLTKLFDEEDATTDMN